MTDRDMEKARERKEDAAIAAYHELYGHSDRSFDEHKAAIDAFCEGWHAALKAREKDDD